MSMVHTRYVLTAFVLRQIDATLAHAAPAAALPRPCPYALTRAFGLAMRHVPLLRRLLARSAPPARPHQPRGHVGSHTACSNQENGP